MEVQRHLDRQGTQVARYILTVIGVVLLASLNRVRGDDTCAPAPDACAPAAPPAPPAPDFGGCFWDRLKLTGDWGGCRNDLAACKGITVDADETMFFDGVVSGGVQQQGLFAGHGDLLMNIDANKLWGQEGFFIKLRAEHRYGVSPDADAGVFLPLTIATNLPVANSEIVCLTDVLFTQALSQNFAVFAGKMDTLDGDTNAYAAGRGKLQFSNVGFVINPTLLRMVPYSTLGAGFVVLHEMQPLFTFSVLNATDDTTTSGFDDLFEQGVVLTAELRLPTTFFDMPGHQLIGGGWNSRTFTSLGQDPRIVLPDVPIATQEGCWGLYYNFDQALIVDPCDPQRNWGVFGRWGISDDRVNPMQSFLSFGVGGSSPWGSRPKDTFGVGWYQANTSSQIGPLLTAGFGPIGDGQAVELFYNYEVTPFCHVTPDMQILRPAREDIATSLFLGVRMKVDF